MSAHPDSVWTHAFCDNCWFVENHEELPDGTVTIRIPIRLKNDVDEVHGRGWEQCCKCGLMTYSGIYVRRRPNEMPWCQENEANNFGQNTAEPR